MFQTLHTAFARLGFALVVFASVWQAQAQQIVSTIPANGAANVSPSAPVIITFSDPLNTDPDITSAMFMYGSTLQPLPTVTTWNSAGNIMTNTPVPPFPSGQTISWFVSGEDLDGFPLLDPPYPFHTFTTSGGGSGTGSGTNRITSFSLGKAWYYNQFTAGASTVDTNAPYAFMATTVLASNRTASVITLTLPNSTISNLQSTIYRSESWSLLYFTTNSTAVDTAFPAGSYIFTVQSTTNQFVTVSFPTTSAMPQPNAPHVTNYAACQAINPSQAFTIGWDAFQSGTSADYIHVGIANLFSTPDALSPGALTGTAQSVQIPAGTLQANSNYTASIGFYRMVFNTNNATYGTTVYRGTQTQFTITTTSAGGSSSLVLTNLSLSTTNSKFNVTSATGQTYTVEYSTSLLPGGWHSLSTTNPVTGRSQFADPHAATNRFMFYRARTGS